MSRPGSTRQEFTDAASGRVLQVELSVHRDGSLLCPINDIEGTIEDMRINAIDGCCHCDIRVTDEQGCTAIVQASGTIESDCFCSTFQRHSCVPQICSIDDDLVVARTYVDGRETVSELIRSLGEIADSVSLHRLTVAGEDGRDTVTFDLSKLTSKQREALELAVSRGYYDTDRSVDLATMADELDISKSALSQRLRVAQSKLVEDLFSE
ncbi:helix-turn-helix domain-containing protein [Natranaeroarchaeum sulfidigenes]|uniref:helix-turn-helix domain-containing protein n=1 Tax=Natranaeroarchaeum sulfidigenes TaxID=2784880 RepID=UPI001EE62613|nr:helix-turn-helix domain-containing protein [Natranaeroarchaeum sulfidigenes]